jgi:hypothetical protein
MRSPRPPAGTTIAGVAHGASLAALAALAGLAGGCGSDPRYLAAPGPIEVRNGPMGATTGTTSVTLPIEQESNADRMARDELAAALGAPVPYVRLGDLDVEIEWTIKNLTGEPGQARVNLTGANELFAYVPVAFVIDPDEDQEPPPLAGNIPIDVGADRVVSGTLREDALREASLDVELITRGGVNPFAAILTRNEDEEAVTLVPEGVAAPIDQLGQMIRYDLTFTADRHMVLEWGVRVRDRRGVLHDDLDAAPAGELTPFTPADYAPPAPPE